LTATAGVSFNKSSSENGIRHQQARWTDGDFARTRPGLVEALPLRSFTALTSHSYQDAQLRNSSWGGSQATVALVQHFGKVGHFYYKIARAEDERVVEP